MPLTRRHFQKLIGSAITLPLLKSCKASDDKTSINSDFNNEDIILSTWNNQTANRTAMKLLRADSSNLLSAIEKGINTVESDPNDMSVGYGGRPDRDGNVTLDACIMDKDGHAGSVTYVQNYMNPISIARKVLEATPHVILSGSGAEKFALEQGFKAQELLTDNSKAEYTEWLKKAEYSPKVNIERHDTIGMIARNKLGELSGGCSTSGLSYKMAGRVGDSPIIGAGLYLDPQYGSATATGLGELVLENCTTFLIVELLRHGYDVQSACEEAIKRIVRKNNTKDIQVGVIAMDIKGNTAAYSIQKGFNYVKSVDENTSLIESKSYYR